MTSRPTRSGIRATRRGLLAGGVGLLGLALAGCFEKRSDRDAVMAALQSAVEKVPGYADGTIGYQDSFGPGTFINAVLVVDTTTRAETEQVLRALLEAIIRAYVEQPNTRKASVRVRVRPDGDLDTVVKAIDVIDAESSTNVTTDDLKREFGLG